MLKCQNKNVSTVYWNYLLHNHQIKVEFINTSEIKNRVFIAKPEYLLKKMDPEDEDIKQPNNIDKLCISSKATS